MCRRKEHQFIITPCKTEPEDTFGSRALDMLREKMKLFELEKIPQLSQPSLQSHQRKNKSQEYQIHSNQKQPQTYSQYRISSKDKSLISKNSGVFTLQALESVKSRLSLQEAQLMDVPIIKVSRKRIPSELQQKENDVSLILMEKYYQSTIKYEEKQSKLALKQQKQIQSQNVMSQLTVTNQAVKNYKRKLKISRREQMEQIQKNKQQNNKSFQNILIQDQQIGNQKKFKPKPQRTIFYRRNLSSI